MITAEVFIHHLELYKDYETKVSLIKWNPAVKNIVTKIKDALWKLF
jgi:dihydroorotase